MTHSGSAGVIFKIANRYDRAAGRHEASLSTALTVRRAAGTPLLALDTVSRLQPKVPVSLEGNAVEE